MFNRLGKKATLVILAGLMLAGYSKLKAEQLANSLYNHGGGEMAVVNDKLYLFNGYSWNVSRKLNGANKLEVYNSVSNTWTELTPVPETRSHSTSFVIDGKIYTVGGQQWQDNFSNKVFRYDPQTNTWSVMNNFPLNAHSLLSATVDGKAYVFGGTITSNYTRPNWNSYMYQYNPQTDTWVQKSRIPLDVQCTNPIVHNGKIYVFGGIHYQTYNPPPLIRYEIQIYDPQTDSWAYGSNLPADFYTSSIPNCGFCIKTFEYGNKAVLFQSSVYGSNTEFGKYVYVYSFENDTWKKYDLTGHLPFESIHFTLAQPSALLGDHVYFLYDLVWGVAGDTLYESGIYRINLAHIISKEHHPADLNEDFILISQEVDNYFNSWKQGNLWQNATIDIDFVTRAGYLWSLDGNYSFDESKNPPECWIHRD